MCCVLCVVYADNDHTNAIGPKLLLLEVIVVAFFSIFLQFQESILDFRWSCVNFLMKKNYSTTCIQLVVVLLLLLVVFVQNTCNISFPGSLLILARKASQKRQDTGLFWLAFVSIRFWDLNLIGGWEEPGLGLS